ncbi:DrmE family protein [Nitrosomonas sp.]|uniref:DrmE family protein n=1 Tax=Nitrosomonas sp. TaxID=42353 RepID=UPI00207F0244|nr:DrmE family protein [Nitrosomonas sp.]GJL75951.1 MAG: hypothetical protein NMNS02_20570 [Nitrosomonas sp.]
MKLADWLNEKFPELKNIEISYGDDDSVKIPFIARLLVAAMLNKNGSDCVFIIPQSEVMASLTALLSALSNTKHNFPMYREDFAKHGLQIGQKVRLIPSNTIYEYAGFMSGVSPKMFRLNLLGANANNGCVSLPLEEVLRLFPTSRTTPMGRGNDTRGVPELSDLDKVIGIKSYGNYSLFKNRIILHSSKGKMDSFLEMWSMHRRNKEGRITASLKDMRDFPWGKISLEGNLQSFNRYQICGEPVIAFSSRLSPTDEYCADQGEDSRTIITSNKKAVLENAYETQNLCERQKFFLLTEEIDAVEASELKDLGFSVWELSRDEIFTGIHNDDDLEEAKKFIPLRMMYGAAGGDKNTIKVHKAESPLLEKIERSIVETGKNIPDSEIDSLTIQSLKRIYWRSLELLGSPEKKYQDWLLNQVLSVDNVLQRQSSFVGKENIEKLKSIMADIMDDLLPSIASHSQSKFNEILNVVHACPGHKVLLLCRHAEALETLRERLNTCPDVTFLTYDEISVAKNVYDVAVMVGWPGKYLFSKLFNSGVTDKIEAVLYHNEIAALNSYFKQKAKAEEAVRLTPGQKAKIIGCPAEMFENSQPEQVAETIKDEPENVELDGIEAKERTAIFNVDWSMRPKLPSVSGPQREQAIDAVYVSFNNDRCAYLTKNHRLPVIDPRTYQYKNKTVEELMAGDIVVFRQSGDREILREIAEKLYPENYEKLAVQAAIWKRWLNALGANVNDIWLKLSEHGLQRNIMTIANWVKNEDLIGPQNLKDILVIAETTGREENIKKAPQVANAVKELRGIHVEAGFKLTKLLMSRLSKELNEDRHDHENLATSLADVELMTVEEVDTEQVQVMPAIANEPHPIWWFDTPSSVELNELLQGVGN